MKKAKKIVKDCFSIMLVAEENLNLLEANRKKQMKIINSILDHFKEN